MICKSFPNKWSAKCVWVWFSCAYNYFTVKKRRGVDIKQSANQQNCQFQGHLNLNSPRVRIIYLVPTPITSKETDRKRQGDIR